MKIKVFFLIISLCFVNIVFATEDGRATKFLNYELDKFSTSNNEPSIREYSKFSETFDNIKNFFIPTVLSIKDFRRIEKKQLESLNVIKKLFQASSHSDEDIKKTLSLLIEISTARTHPKYSNKLKKKSLSVLIYIAKFLSKKNNIEILDHIKLQKIKSLDINKRSNQSEKLKDHDWSMIYAYYTINILKMEKNIENFRTGVSNSCYSVNHLTLHNSEEVGNGIISFIKDVIFGPIEIIATEGLKAPTRLITGAVMSITDAVVSLPNNLAGIVTQGRKGNHGRDLGAGIMNTLLVTGGVKATLSAKNKKVYGKYTLKKKKQVVTPNDLRQAQQKKRAALLNKAKVDPTFKQNIHAYRQLVGGLDNSIVVDLYKTHPHLGKLKRGSDLISIVKSIFLKYNNNRLYDSTMRNSAEISTAIYLRELFSRNQHILKTDIQTKHEVLSIIKSYDFVKNMKRAKRIESIAKDFELEQ